MLSKVATIVFLVGLALGQNFEDARRIVCSPTLSRFSTLTSSTVIPTRRHRLQMITIPLSQPTKSSTDTKSTITSGGWDWVTEQLNTVAQNQSMNIVDRNISGGNNWITNQVDLIRIQQANQTNEQNERQYKMQDCQRRNKGLELFGDLVMLLTATRNMSSCFAFNEWNFGSSEAWIQMWLIAHGIGGGSGQGQLNATQYMEFLQILSVLESGQIQSSAQDAWIIQEIKTKTFRYYDSNFSWLTQLQLDTWFQLTQWQQNMLLKDNGIYPGFGFGGYLALLSRLAAYQQSRCDGGSGGGGGEGEGRGGGEGEGRGGGEEGFQTWNSANYTSSYENQSDIFLIVAQSLLSRDISSTMDATLFGRLYSHNGRLYRLDSTTGKLVMVADLTPATAIETILGYRKGKTSKEYSNWLTTKLKQSREIETLLCVYQSRDREDKDMNFYYANLDNWFRWGRVRGMALPEPPQSALAQCQDEANQLKFVNGTQGDSIHDNGAWNQADIFEHGQSHQDKQLQYQEHPFWVDSFYRGKDGTNAWNTLQSGQSVDQNPQIQFDVESKLERLCKLRQNNLISSTEYDIIRQMIEDYANTRPGETSPSSSSWPGNDSVQSLTQLLSRIKRSPYAPPAMKPWRYFDFFNPLRPRRRCLPSLLPLLSQ